MLLERRSPEEAHAWGNAQERLTRWSHKAPAKAPASLETDRSARPTHPVESTALRM